MEKMIVLDNEARSAFIKGVFEQYCLPVLQKKGHDYSETSGNSVNSNFDKVKERLPNASRDAIDVWAVYWEKHVMAIETWLNKRKLKSTDEDISGRLTDLINYSFILWSILYELGLVKCPDGFEPKNWIPESFSKHHFVVHDSYSATLPPNQE